MSTDENKKPSDPSSDPSKKGEGSGSGSGEKPRLSPHEYEAETFIGYSNPAAVPSKPHDPDATIGPQRAANPPAPPGKPGAWSGANSNILGHAQNPGGPRAGVGGARPPTPPIASGPANAGGKVSDSWDQSANATQMTIPSGRSASGFGTAKTLDRGRIGPYPLERELGRGGMGVVYLARDEKLGRLVAIKVLPDMFAQHPERAARFEREARLLASLNHPNIAAIYELGEEEGSRYLTLEYVPGLTLSEKLQAGQIPIDEAMHISAQIAEGLEAAHEKGVIHRDLKPGNVKITPEGLVKVLDFGLAKSSGPDGNAEEVSPDMPTGALGNTQEGMILGTAGYMSPEQARGRPLDKRTDVWSFGCVLYETLTGRSPFYADTVSDTIALILRTDPDWTALPPETPEKVRELLRRCFIKDPKRRLRDLGEARIELQAAHQQVSSFGGMASASTIASASTMGAPSTQAVARSATQEATWWHYVPWAMAGLAVAVAAMVTAALFLKTDGMTGAGGGGAGIAGVVRFSVSLPSGIEPSPRGVVPLLAVSTDERWVVVSGEQDGRRRLYARGLDGMNFGPVGQIVGATAPFFSPDSSQFGFVRNNLIERVNVESLRVIGGSEVPTTVVEGISGEVAGATWTDSGEIVYAVSSGPERGLFRARADQRTRGQPLLAAQPGEELLWPHAVLRAGQGGDLIVYTVRRGGSMTVRWLSMTDPTKNGELTSGGAASLVGRGVTRYLVYAVGGGLEATSVQIGSAGITNLGGVQSLQRGIAFTPDGASHFALSDDGLLAFLPDAERPRRMQLAPLREGASAHAELLSATGVGGEVRVDPANPQRMAFITNEESAPVRVITVGQPPVDLTTINGRVTSMAWRPRQGSGGAGGSVLTMSVQTSDRTGVFEWNETSGSIEEVSLGRLSQPMVHSWDRRGQSLFITSETSTGSRELRRSASGTTVQLPTDEGLFADVVPSPDATHFAYTRLVSAVPTVHMRANRETATSFALPGGPSWAPLWIPREGATGVGGGGTLLFQRIDGLHAIEITSDPEAPLGASRLVSSFPGVPGAAREYDAAGDGSWVIAPVIERGQGGEVRLVVNFQTQIASALSGTP